MAWISTFVITKISTDGSLDTFWTMNRVRNPVWISCVLKKKILPGACISPRLQYTRDYGLFPLLIVNHWISLCHSQFYVLYWHFSSPLYRFFVWCLLTCHNDVIDAGHNNRLFAPGTDMDRERLRLSHLQNVGLVEWYANLFTLKIVIFPSGVVLGKYDLSRVNKCSYSIL